MVRRSLALEILVLAAEVPRVSLLDHPLEGARLAERSRRDCDRAELGSALGFDQHPVVAVQDQRARIELVDLAAWPEADADGDGSGRRPETFLLHHAGP